MALLMFFGLHLFCLLYTDNIDSGFFDVETKLSFLIYPLFMTNNFNYIAPKLNWIFWAFILGVLAASLSCLGHSLYLFVFYDAPFQYFTYTDLSIFMHPSYFAMYVSFALVILFFLFTSSPKKLKYLISVLIVYLGVFSFLLSSKSGLITFVFIFVTGIFFIMKKSLKSFLILSVLIGVLGLVLLRNDRFIQFKNVVIEQFSVSDTKHTNATESSNERLTIWKTSLTVLKENWLFGVGAGDVKYVLNKRYPSSFAVGKEKLFNAHNQFLETWLATGIIGLLILIFMLIWPFYLGIRNKDFLSIGFSMILMVNFMVESVLNSQAGILFFAFFFMLVTLRNEKFLSNQLSLE
jgi:O-antigen ligase